ncbi:MAG TPA: hypothetical protein VMV83_11885 [Rectinemataceae bacterium]|nr:hypothetical protein [Rectinemataceae bacterium]
MAESKGREGWIPSVRAGALRALFVSSVLAFSQASWPEGPSVSPEASVSAPATPRISASELERLSAISTRLAELNERLRTELEVSRRNSSGLEASLADSTQELGELRLELERFRLISSELELRATSSERESIALSEALRKAEDSLRSLEVSFADYRKAAEARSLRISLLSLGAGLAALAGWTVALFVVIIK